MHKLGCGILNEKEENLEGEERRKAREEDSWPVWIVLFDQLTITWLERKKLSRNAPNGANLSLHLTRQSASFRHSYTNMNHAIKAELKDL